MFTNIEKSPENSNFASKDLIDKTIESKDQQRVDLYQPKAPEGLLSIATATLFNNEECKKIIDSCIGELWTPVKVYGSGNIHRASMQRLRGNLSEHPLNLFREAIVSANAEIYNFSLVGMIDLDYPQVARYSKGDFYDLHTEINPMTLTRKLSFLVMLNDPSEYEGGEIEFLNTELKHEETSQVGTMLIFPSFLTYRIKPVKKGSRYVVTGSIHGDSFK